MDDQGVKDIHESYLEMSFMPNTIGHLGARLYSIMPPVIVELVANSYDADASKVATTEVL